MKSLFKNEKVSSFVVRTLEKIVARLSNSCKITKKKTKFYLRILLLLKRQNAHGELVAATYATKMADALLIQQQQQGFGDLSAAQRCLLYSLYANFIEVQDIIWRKTQNQLLTAAYSEDAVYNEQVKPLLQIFYGLISESMLVDGEIDMAQAKLHSLFTRVLMPLHKKPEKDFCRFREELRQLLELFITKKPVLYGRILLNTILGYWPVASGKKQLVFFEELVAALQWNPSLYSIEGLAVRIIKKLCKCLDGNNIRATQALLDVLTLLESEELISKALQKSDSQKKVVELLLYPRLQAICRSDWWSSRIATKNAARKLLQKFGLKAPELPEKQKIEESRARAKKKATAKARAKGKAKRERERQRQMRQFNSKNKSSKSRSRMQRARKWLSKK